MPSNMHDTQIAKGNAGEACLFVSMVRQAENGLETSDGDACGPLDADVAVHEVVSLLQS